MVRAVERAVFRSSRVDGPISLTHRHAELAEHHGALAILAEHPGWVDPLLQERARDARRRQALWESHFLPRTQAIVQGLSEVGVRAVPLKGMAICPEYPQRGWRPFSDADLWIDRDQVRTAHTYLSHEGFEPLPSQSPLPKAQPNLGDPIEACEAGIDALGYQKQGYGLEVHTVLLPPMLGRYPGHGMDDVDRLNHFLIHAVRHHFSHGLRHPLDLALWIDRKKPSIDAAIERLRECGLYDLAWPAWQIATDHFPDRIAPWPKPARRFSIAYAKRLGMDFERVPELSKGFAGSPLPCLMMVDRSFSALANAWGGSPEIRRYREGKTSVGTLRRLTRTLVRHGKIALRWATFWIG